jgi:hypothetical protein
MIRKVITILIFLYAYTITTVSGQYGGKETLPKVSMVLDLKLGSVNQQNFTTAAMSSGYKNALNTSQGNITNTANKSIGFDLRFGYYLNRKRSLGFGSGFVFLKYTSNLLVDTFHVEYQSTDFQGSTFRQSVSSNQTINERIKSTNISIPVLLLYRQRLTNGIYFVMDAGIVINAIMQHEYNTEATFNYEAIYKYTGSGNVPGAVFDDAPTPGKTDWIVTQDQFIKKNPTGNAQQYFDDLQDLGYNVGIDEKVVQNNGTVDFKRWSIGYIVQPGVEQEIKNRVFLKIGLYYMSQSFTNYEGNNSLRITNRVGDYNSMMNKVKTMESAAYGLNLGLKFLIKE